MDTGICFRKVIKIFYIMAACCVMFGLTSCNNEDSTAVDNSKSVKQINDSLKICMPESDSWVFLAVRKFKEQYPEVKVELQIVSDDSVNEQGKVIASELMAGDGADIYICAECLPSNCTLCSDSSIGYTNANVVQTTWQENKSYRRS